MPSLCQDIVYRQGNQGPKVWWLSSNRSWYRSCVLGVSWYPGALIWTQTSWTFLAKWQNLLGWLSQEDSYWGILIRMKMWLGRWIWWGLDSKIHGKIRMRFGFKVEGSWVLGLLSVKCACHPPCECSGLVSRGVKEGSLVTLKHSLKTTDQKEASEIFVEWNCMTVWVILNPCQKIYISAF